jgi:hypothetical protein
LSGGPRRGLARAVPLLACAGLAACQTPAPPTQAEIVREQLAQILSAQVPGCDTVSLYKRRERFDYLVQCASGQAYRLRLGADGKVQVTQATLRRPGRHGG